MLLYMSCTRMLTTCRSIILFYMYNMHRAWSKQNYRTAVFVQHLKLFAVTAFKVLDRLHITHWSTRAPSLLLQLSARCTASRYAYAHEQGSSARMRRRLTVLVFRHEVCILWILESGISWSLCVNWPCI